MTGLQSLSDRELVARLRGIAGQSALVEAELLLFLGEVDARRVYADEGCTSMHAYCTGVLSFSEASAYHRITAARLARRFPPVLECVRSGELHLSGVALLASHLSEENCQELLAVARRKIKREIEALLAERRPRPSVPAVMRKLPARSVAATQTAAPPATRTPAPRAPALQPLGEQRFKVQFTADRELHAKISEARALIRHRVPDGDLAAIFGRALDRLIRDVKRARCAQTDRPRRSGGARPKSRHIPAAIRRAVWERDGARCAFVAPSGRRCEAADFLEFHHRQPWARAGEHSVANIVLLCRTHNQRAAERDFGRGFMARCRALPGES